ncbi:hypothetical protein JX265_011572 [Neoarthrinium moseri]|uniref:Uncharacterized protein n=1 Tax=Neoarthrinium moseri TaxID=1658444 RepID=A0A9Q0AHI0_9PEZI|nr:uncharacterized protein JN550_011678 [Neoarthrinium moseri]KAI1848574.1 hypothetical protein JX266_005433 [Neoarthrinium moseri]KAI1856613.1 hypothetical protein JX265_011572 [Neoarthrinium moseri]KAI1859994.1 hypothetical protein JN550_011678 [Neoarthrinium moseri]
MAIFNQVFFWSLQIQLLLQIIINRVSLLMVSKRQASRLKWSVFAIILAINISVFCIWVPARLQINETYIHVNEVWDRLEKGIFCVIDAGLNLHFVHLVRSRLVAYGLTKYTRLYKTNLVMIAISVSLDIALIGTMSLHNSFVYLLFHPVAYLLKLHIEMNMADLIAKVVKATNPGQDPYKSKSKSDNHTSTVHKSHKMSRILNTGRDHHSTRVEAGGDAGNDIIELQEQGIRRVIKTEVIREDFKMPIETVSARDDDIESRSSSTRKLRDYDEF